MNDLSLTQQLELLVRLGWIAAFCVAVFAAAFAIVGGIAFWRSNSGQAKSFSLLFERAQALRISAVVFIIISVLVLGILGKLEAPEIAAVLSGVAGYVLGGLDKDQKKDEGE